MLVWFSLHYNWGLIFEVRCFFETDCVVRHFKEGRQRIGQGPQAFRRVITRWNVCPRGQTIRAKLNSYHVFPMTGALRVLPRGLVSHSDALAVTDTHHFSFGHASPLFVEGVKLGALNALASIPFVFRGLRYG